MRLVAIIIIAAFSAMGPQEKTTGEPPVPLSGANVPLAGQNSEAGSFGDSKPAPQALSCMEPVKDFGLVEEGTKLSHTFIIGNISREAVEVDRVISSCGCVVTAKQSFKLGPDEGEEIAISLDTMGYGGTEVEKTISVHEKGDTHSPLVLTVKAQVKGIPPEKRVILTPKDKAIDGDPNRRHTLYLQVPNDPNITFTVQPPEWLHSSMQKSKRQNMSGVVMWEVEIWPAKRLRERMTGELVVNSNCAKFEKVKAPIQVVPRPAFMFDPYMVSFNKSESMQTKTLIIRSGDCRVQSVGSSVEIRPSSECLRVKRVGNTPDSEIRLEIENTGCEAGAYRLEVLLDKEVVGTIPVLVN